MPFLRPTTFPFRAPRVLSQRASLHASAMRAVGKETAEHGPERVAEIEKAKKEQQDGAKTGSNTWKEELASEGEANVKADKNSDSIHELQKKSTEHMKKK